MRCLSLVRRVTVGSVAVLALASVAGCDDEPGPDVATESAEPAEPTGTEPAETEPVAGDQVDPSAFIAEVLDSLADATTAHVTVEMQGGPAAMTAEGDIDYATSPPSMAMTLTNQLFGDGTMELRLVDRVMYVLMDTFATGKWVRVDLDDKDSPLGEGFTDQLDPGVGLEFVEDAVVSVTYVGDEDVDGEAVDHYTMEVRAEAVRELQDKFGGEAGLDVPDVVGFDVWIDDEGLLRQTTMSIGDVGSVTTTISAWGEPVDIQAPPDEDVLKLGG